MHLLSAQAGALQQEGDAIDLGQTAAPVVFASAADSELAMLAAAADRAGTSDLRLANILRLGHNLSVDLWLEKTVRHAKLVVVRLLGGASYWQYGVDELMALALGGTIRLALLPGDANPDPILRDRSTIHPDDWARLHALFTAGGPENADALLAGFRLLATPLPTSPTRGEVSAGGRGAVVPHAPDHTLPLVGRDGEGVLANFAPQHFPRFGLWFPGKWMVEAEELTRIADGAVPSPPSLEGEGSRVGGGAVVHRSTPTPDPSPQGGGEPRLQAVVGNAHIPILFYRAALEGAGTATLEALIEELERRGLMPVPVVVSTLKEGACVRFVREVLARFPPSAILNLTGFALGLDGLEEKLNPFAGTDAPVLQLLQGGRPEAQWAADSQGLTGKDLAMQVVLPEMDGRIGALLVGHKEESVWHERTQCPLSAYAPDAGGIHQAVALAGNWARLRATPRAERRVAIVLANYPIRDGRLANGVGYDAPQSTVEILRVLEGAGYSLAAEPVPFSSTPTPDPSPQGGGEREAGGVGKERESGAVFSNARHLRSKRSVLARSLRNNASVPERLLWPLLKNLNGDGVRFRRQVPIGPYVADFACHHPKLVVEVDGSTHFTDEAESRDRKRDAFLASVGYRVIRVATADVATNPDGVLQLVEATLAELSLPSPLRGGVGGGGPSVNPCAIPATGNALIELLQAGPTNAHPERGEGVRFPVARYRELLRALPQKIRDEVTSRWGAPEADPFVRGDDFHLPALRLGNVAILLQPARGYDRDETASYHDPDLVPPHAYLAAYLWLRHEFAAHALIHNGKHGNLEWLPGKATALDAASYPLALWGTLPHLYPFIVNDPGEGTQAKRRAGAVIIDHLVPPLTRAESYGPLKDLEALLDEYYAASGMDRRRLAGLRRRILDFTRDSRLDRDIGLPGDETEALKKIDTLLCDLKEAQIRDGLHIFGQSPEGELERDLVVALARVPRGEGPGEASLIRALADDLKLGFDPLTAKLGERWSGPTLEALLPVATEAAAPSPPLPP